MTVQHNMMAINSNRMLGITTYKKAKTTEKLSSGYRINRAADDAAGLAISEKMRRQIRGLNQGIENSQDGVSACQIMDGALEEIQDILHRMTELSVKAANGTWNSDDRSYIQEEMKQLQAEIDRTSDTTTFNELPLLSEGDLEFVPSRANANSGKTDVIFVIDNTGSMGDHVANVKNNIASFANSLANCNVNYGMVVYGELSEGASKSSSFGTNADGLKNAMKSIKVNGGGDYEESALEAIMHATTYPFRSDATKELILVTDASFHDKNLDKESAYTYSDVKSKLNADNIRLSVATVPECKELYRNTLANGKILDLNSDFYNSLLGLAKDICESAGEMVHKSPADIPIQVSGEQYDRYIIKTYNVSSSALGVSNVNCADEENAQKSIDIIKYAEKKLAYIRSSVGADQNALEHIIKNNSNVSENTTAAESRIRDTDMAEEMVFYSGLDILMQAGQSMLAQANQSNQGVLSLL